MSAGAAMGMEVRVYLQKYWFKHSRKAVAAHRASGARGSIHMRFRLTARTFDAVR